MVNVSFMISSPNKYLSLSKGIKPAEIKLPLADPCRIPIISSSMSPNTPLAAAQGAQRHSAQLLLGTIDYCMGEKASWFALGLRWFFKTPLFVNGTINHGHKDWRHTWLINPPSQSLHSIKINIKKITVDPFIKECFTNTLVSDMKL